MPERWWNTLGRDITEVPAMPLQYTCIQCGELFKVPPSRLNQKYPIKFCSRACYHESRATSHVDIPCATCGTIIHAGRINVRPDRKYCSFTCYIQAPKAWALAPEHRTCRHCEQSFLCPTSNRNRLYCSKECWQQAHAAQEIPCIICGTRFKAKPSEVAKGKRFCSFTCRDHAEREASKRTCVVCGATYRADRPSRPSSFCSAACRVESRKKRPQQFDCLYCGTPVVRRAGQAPGQYCSIACASAWRVRHTDAGFKPALRRLTPRKPYEKPGYQKKATAVRKRDGYQCQQCGRQWKRGMRTFEVHHIIPIRPGGLDTMDNVFTLFIRCHRRADLALRGT